jgi:type I pantothenate kinase
MDRFIWNIMPKAVEENDQRYHIFTREEWARRRGGTPLTLSEERLTALRGLNDRVSLQEVEQIYLPLSRLLHLYVTAVEQLHGATAIFLGANGARVPYVIGIVGSVAVGKSTTARLLQALLADWPSRPTVELVPTDAFLYTNQYLEKRGWENRKGFPETYDLPRLVRFLSEVKSGAPAMSVPVYSHHIYDILPNEVQTLRRPDILIVEGLNLLQAGTGRMRRRQFVSDFFDMTIYVDAEEADIEQWFIERFMMLRDTAFHDPTSFFTRFTSLNEEESVQMARYVWQEINGRNLHENILPTRERAQLILHKGRDHAVQEIRLRKL